SGGAKRNSRGTTTKRASTKTRADGAGPERADQCDRRNKEEEPNPGNSRSDIFRTRPTRSSSHSSKGSRQQVVNGRRKRGQVARANTTSGEGASRRQHKIGEMI